MRLVRKNQQKIKLIKKDGEEYDFMGNLQSNEGKMITAFLDIKFEKGDCLERKINNGIVEKYVIQNVYYSKDFVNMDIRNIENTSEDENKISTIKVDEVKGNVFVNPVLNHSSIVYMESDYKIFDELKEAMANTNEEILSAIDEMQRNIGKKTFVDKYNEFIQLAASYMTIASPFLPVLGEYLKQSLK